MYKVLLDAAGETTGGIEIWGTLLMFVPLILIVYFLMIRPENKRKKKAQQLRDELIVGDVVTTVGGIVGRVINIKDDEIVVESSYDKSKVQLKKWAISSKEEKISD